MNAFDFLKQCLQEKGYGGLYIGGCSCFIDDLCNCNQIPKHCKPGYKVMCKPEDCETCSISIDDCQEHVVNRWRISEVKPE